MSESSPENTQPRTSSSFFSLKKIIIIFFGILIICGIATSLFYAFWQGQVFYNRLLADNKHWQHIIHQNQETIEALQKNMLDMQQKVQHSQELLQQQMQKINSLEENKQNPTDTWRALEADYLVRLANDHLQFIQDVPLAIALLKQAISTLQPTEDLALKRLQESIKSDIAKLEVLPVANTQALYTQLISLNNQIDSLPLRPLQTKNPVILSKGASWWETKFNELLTMLKKIVVIHYQEEKDLPLLLPQEKVILYQNLHAQMQNVIWAVMYKQQVIYNDSLTQLISWIEKYFDLTIPSTQTFLSHLQTLKKQQLQMPVTNLNTTIQQFDTSWSKQT